MSNRLIQEMQRIHAIADRDARIVEARRFCVREPGYAPAWFNLASDLVAAGDAAGAREAALRVRGLDPTQEPFFPPSVRALLVSAPEAAPPNVLPAAPDKTLAEASIAFEGASFGEVTAKRLFSRSDWQWLFDGQGAGGMCALRLLSGLSPGAALRTLRRELAVAGRLEGVPGCARVRRIGYGPGGIPAGILEPLVGKTLADAVAAAPLAPAHAIDVVLGAAEAVGRIGEVLGCHGAVRPEHILCTRDGRFLGMLGAVGRDGAADGRQTLSGDAELDGWRAPEAVTGAPGPRSDVYGLGGVLCHALTGERRPPAALALFAVGNRTVVDDDGGAPSAGARSLREIPREVWLLIGRALETDPLSRPATPGAFAAALRDIRARALDVRTIADDEAETRARDAYCRRLEATRSAPGDVRRRPRTPWPWLALAAALGLVGGLLLRLLGS